MREPKHYERTTYINLHMAQKEVEKAKGQLMVAERLLRQAEAKREEISKDAAEWLRRGDKGRAVVEFDQKNFVLLVEKSGDDVRASIMEVVK